MKNKFGLKSFLELYGSEDICLQRMFNMRYGALECCPRCAVVGAKFYRIRKRKSFECGECGHQIYPLAGTIMHGSNVPANLWFLAIFLFVNSKNGVSAMELQRVLEVSYKTAWRMGHKIRSLMSSEGENPLFGTVEIDEALIGGKAKGKRGWAASNKTSMFGMIERGYRARVFCIPNRTHNNILPVLLKNIKVGSSVYSDEWMGYKRLENFGYEHKHVNHSKFEWSKGDTHTNSIEGYWSNLKKSIFGTHTFVSPKYLQKYLDEHSFRYSHRNAESIFNEIITKL
jgi:transposase